MDSNSTLFWLVLISCAIVLMRTRSSHSFRGRRFLTVLLIAGTVAVFYFLPDYGGYIAGIAWFLVLVFPSLGTLLVGDLMARRRFYAAERAATVIAWVYPVDGYRVYPKLVQALGQINAGHGEQAKHTLIELSQSDHAISWTAKVLLTRMTSEWQSFLDWLTTHPHGGRIVQDPMVLEGYLQALGETGNLEKLLQEFKRRLSTGSGLSPPAYVNISRLKLAAFAGDPQTAEVILQAIPETPIDVADYWRATAWQAASRDDQAIPLLAALSGSQDSRVCDAALRRLQQPVRRDLPEELRSHLSEMLAEIRESVSHERQFSIASQRLSRRPWVTWGIGLALLIMFAFEIPGGSTDIDNLIRLGALVVPPLPDMGGTWRFVAAAFLHSGPMHLMLNLFGLMLFGARVEKIAGHLGLLVTYLTAAIGSVALIPYFSDATAESPFVLVGASGGVMGLAGAILGFQFLGLVIRRNPRLRQEFRLLLFLIVLQTIFDVMTPNVSTTCHVLGLGIGILFGSGTGLWLWLRQPSAAQPPESGRHQEIDSSLRNRSTV